MMVLLVAGIFILGSGFMFASVMGEVFGGLLVVGMGFLLYWNRHLQNLPDLPKPTREERIAAKRDEKKRLKALRRGYGR